MPSDDEKPKVEMPLKSSMEILSELFSTFDAEPPLIIKQEKIEEFSKKHKKSKKKHKHKDKKRKKKDKKRKRNLSNSSESSEPDVTESIIKKEKNSSEKQIELDKNVVSGIEKEDKKEVKADASPLNEPATKQKTNDKSETADKEKKSKENSKHSKEHSTGKITIKNLKFSSIFEATIREVQEKEQKQPNEDGELIDNSDSESLEDNDLNISVEKKEKRKRKRKHKNNDDQKPKKKKHSHRNQSKEKHEKSHIKSQSKRDHDKGASLDKTCEEKEDSKKSKHKDSTYKSDGKYKDLENFKSKHKDYKYKDKDDYRDYHKDYESKSYRQKENSFYRDDDYYKTRDGYQRDRERDDKWFMRDRYRGYSDFNKERDKKYKSESRDNDVAYIDKKKLLEIARKNAIQMMKSGNLPAALTLGPQAQEKVLAAIKAGGKTIEELTDFCKTLSRKEELGELSSLSGDEGNGSDTEKAFHHPFQIKDRPTSIVMNIKNSVPLPTKTAHERTAELRIQFPVSSGQQHRKTEGEWIPVAPKKAETPPLPVPKPVQVSATVLAQPVPLPVEAPPVVNAPVDVPPGPQVFHNQPDQNIDIGSIVSQRLSAMRKLQENPHDVLALTEMYKAQKEMQSWAESKQQPGQFTGSTGAQILSQAELASGYQTWARKDQLQCAAPVSGGMGMHLLQKMGWRPGEGLGKEKTGALEPLLLEVKLDKKGLVANEEQKKKQKVQKITIKTLEGKHPVSLLGEYTAKRKLGAPQYNLCFECGPDHKKNFLFKVIVNGIEYKPNIASPNKKQAKADAAKVCLQQLGLLSS